MKLSTTIITYNNHSLSNGMCNSYNYFRGVFSCRNMAAVPVFPALVKKEEK